VVVMAPADQRYWWCADCGNDTLPHEQYMLFDAVWAQAGGGDGFLCVGCLEDRLDRRLTPDDFLAVPLNDDSELDSVRLRSRKRSGVVMPAIVNDGRCHEAAPEKENT
jgi:hypothetical protein